MQKIIYFASLIFILFSCNNGKKEQTAHSKSTKIYCLIIDGSGSKNNHSIPPVEANYISELIDSISTHGGGDLRLDYVDIDANDNQPVFLNIPSLPIKPLKPLKETGEYAYSYKPRYQQFKKDSIIFITTIESVKSKINSLKNDNAQEINSFLQRGYAPRGREQDRSDCNGVLNSCFKAIGNNEGYILAFSDLEDDVGKILESKKINTRIFRINQTNIQKLPFEVIETENGGTLIKTILK